MNKGEKRNGAAFYIALCCCVAVIGAVGYIGRYASKEAEVGKTAQNVSADIAPQSTPIMLVPAEPTQKPSPVKTAAPQKAKKAVETAAAVGEKKVKPTPEPPKFTAPCSGKVIKEMSGEELEYNEILGDWRTHNGVDIASDAGGEIKAVHSGTVTEMFDGALGSTVITDCKNGFTAVYACLAESDEIRVGQEINAGDVIGRAGGTGSENAKEPHLHFELIKNGSYVDPRDYIKFGE